MPGWWSRRTAFFYHILNLRAYLPQIHNSMARLLPHLLHNVLYLIHQRGRPDLINTKLFDLMDQARE